MSNSLTQTTSPMQAAGGHTLPLLRTQFGGTKQQAVTTSAGASIQVHTSDYDRAVRIWAIDCAVVYVFGSATGMAAPNANSDGYVGKDNFVETWMAPDENWIRCAAAAGTGSVRIEVLR